jgi:hypothetical protein
LKNEVGNAQARPSSIAKLRQQNGRNENFRFCDIAADGIRKAADEHFPPTLTFLTSASLCFEIGVLDLWIVVSFTLFEGIDPFLFSPIFRNKVNCM